MGYIKLEEDLISDETAILAKEVGLSIGATVFCKFCDNEGSFFSGLDLPKNRGGVYHKPTQARVQKWLRKVYDIHCYADCDHLGWFWSVEKTNGSSIVNQAYWGRYESHEEALEIGLLRTFELIKKTDYNKK